MKKLLLFIFLIQFVVFESFSQMKLRIDRLPENTPGDASFFVAGNFNNWNPADADFKFQLKNKKFEVNIPAGFDTIKFKITRGSWETVETNKTGLNIADRTEANTKAKTLNINIESWFDKSNPNGTGSTISENVHLLDSAFYMPQLKRYRRIWIYLPPDYSTSDKQYPVMYMHDGQNLFDTKTSFAGEWGIDETINKAHAQGNQTCIVVGIDNGGELRIAELTPYRFPKYNTGEGQLYMQFIAETLKPYIDSLYRTKPEREHTALAGSSLGGLISLYGGLKFDAAFGFLGIFSPAYWINKNEIFELVENFDLQPKTKIYTLMGGQEGSKMVEQFEEMNSLLSKKLNAENLRTKLQPEGKHNEAFWRSEFEAMFKFFVE